MFPFVGHLCWLSMPIPIPKSQRFWRIFLLSPLLLLVVYLLILGWAPISQSIPAQIPLSPPQPESEAKPSPLKNIPETAPLSRPTAPSVPSLDAKIATTIPGIPDKIWQSAKDTALSGDQLEWTRSWTEKNPSFRQELLTDKSSETFVRNRFEKTRPDIVELYNSLRVAILRADLLRYLILLAEGGIWSDLDVTCELEVSRWNISKVLAASNAPVVDMIVGLEFDLDWRGEGSQVASQFTNWVFAARPSSHHLEYIVDMIADKLRLIAHENAVGIDGLTLEMLRQEVVDVTGPKIMTIGLLKSLGLRLKKAVDDRNFSHIKEPRLIGDVLILPGNAFAAAQNGYPDDQGEKFVSHHYSGSWKTEAAEAREKWKQEKEYGKSAGKMA